MTEHAPSLDLDCISWWWLRRLGFELSASSVSPSPWMIRVVAPGVVLQVTRDGDTGGWPVWLRARSRSFYLRKIRQTWQLAWLIETLQGAPVEHVQFDEIAFVQELRKEQAACRERFKRYSG